jgi:hypothetical protein
MSFVILMRRRHLDNTTFFVFPKHVILKRENNTNNEVALMWCHVIERTRNIPTPLAKDNPQTTKGLSLVGTILSYFYVAVFRAWGAPPPLGGGRLLCSQFIWRWLGWPRRLVSLISFERLQGQAQLSLVSMDWRRLLAVCLKKKRKKRRKKEEEAQLSQKNP